MFLILSPFYSRNNIVKIAFKVKFPDILDLSKYCCKNVTVHTSNCQSLYGNYPQNFDKFLQDISTYETGLSFEIEKDRDENREWFRYHLVSIVRHQGFTANQGHYTCDINNDYIQRSNLKKNENVDFDGVKHNWNRCDDSIISYISQV